MSDDPTSSYPPSHRTVPTRAAQRISYDREAVHAVLDEALVSHVGFVVDGEPVVLPHVHARVGDALYLHGSTGARALRDGGLDVCVTVTLVDGLVLARSAFHHSVNYRCVVAHGRAVPVSDPDERSTALTALVDAAVPGRSAETREPSRKELAATAVLRLDLVEVSLKVRGHSAVDDAEDLDGPHWAGVVPLRTVAGGPEPAPDLRPGIPVPDSVRNTRGQVPVGP